MSGQYHHGPMSPNINWVLNCGFSGLQTVQKKKKTDGVFVNEEDLMDGGRGEESE